MEKETSGGERKKKRKIGKKGKIVRKRKWEKMQNCKKGYQK